MKQISLLFLVVLLACCSTPQERVIDHPQYLVRNTSSVEVSKVELTDSTTVLHIFAKFRPKNWIQFAPETRLTDNNGKDYTVLSGIGITPGEHFWMPESGEAEFQLVFPALDKGVTSIDLTEGEHVERGFSIWGIQLRGNLPKLKLPKEIKPSKEMYSDALPEAELKNGIATIQGKLLDYRPAMGKKLIVITEEFVKGHLETEVEITPDGSFTAELPVLSTTFAYLRLGENVNVATIIEPDKTLQIVVNLRELSRRSSNFHSDAEPYGKIMYSDSPWDQVMNEWVDAPRVKTIFDMDVYETTMKKAAEMETLAQFKEYALALNESNQNLIDSAALCPALKQMLDFQNKGNLFYSLEMADYALATAREELKKLDRKEAMILRMKLAEGLNEEGYFNTEVIQLMNDPHYLPFLGMTHSNYTISKLIEKDKMDVPLLAAAFSAKNIYAMISEQFTPLAGETRAMMKEQNLPQAYVDFLNDANEKLLAKLEYNKKRTDFTVNETGKVANKDLFASLISKYRGKVILVDFWQTWCGPCRMGHKEMAPMKEELKGKDIVYLYIAGDSSPEDTWKNMIPDIPGEHFRLDADQWRYICNEFGINGVPTYMIVDKEGNIKYKQVGFPGANVIKGELLKVLK